MPFAALFDSPRRTNGGLRPSDRPRPLRPVKIMPVPKDWDAEKGHPDKGTGLVPESMFFIFGRRHSRHTFIFAVGILDIA
jgi:hypothetical protein